MNDFLTFLQSECFAIKSLVDEVGETQTSLLERMNMKIVSHVSVFPHLKEYYEIEDTDLNTELNLCDTLSETNYANDRHSEGKVSWSHSIRLTIIDHL
jgi:hypothetical protein